MKGVCFNRLLAVSCLQIMGCEPSLDDLSVASLWTTWTNAPWNEVIFVLGKRESCSFTVWWFQIFYVHPYLFFRRPNCWSECILVEESFPKFKNIFYHLFWNPATSNNPQPFLILDGTTSQIQGQVLPSCHWMLFGARAVGKSCCRMTYKCPHVPHEKTKQLFVDWNLVFLFPYLANG